jgi:hypothetical protein
MPIAPLQVIKTRYEIKTRYDFHYFLHRGIKAGHSRQVIKRAVPFALLALF